MPVVSMSLTNDLLRKLDALIADKSYSSRSEAIRDAIRASLSEYELSRLDRGLEVFIAQGAVEDVLNFVGRVRAIRGIQQVKYTVVPLQVE
jgi:metal-responsive CopG/Arc/MetJ family transcriptional regulator